MKRETRIALALAGALIIALVWLAQSQQIQPPITPAPTMALVSHRTPLRALAPTPLPAGLVTSGQLYLIDEGIFRWYNEHGGVMANGETFDARLPTAAHRTIPLGSVVLAMTERGWMWVKITDRGPYCPHRSADPSDGLRLEELDLRAESCPYILDLSPAAAAVLIGEYGYNTDGIPYGQAWGTIWVTK